MKGMNPAITSHDAFDRAIEPLIKVFSRDQAAQIASFHADTELQDRIEELATKANEGELTESELAEYEGYAQANRFIAVLQAKVKGLINEPNGQQ
jgi:hypothetical protein